MIKEIGVTILAKIYFLVALGFDAIGAAAQGQYQLIGR
jgi:hypothetical protein